MRAKENECDCSLYKTLTKLVSAIYWCTFLLKSDSYYVPYLFVGIIGGICFVDNFREKVGFRNRADKIMTRCYGMAFSIMVTLANYNIFLNTQIPVEYAGAFLVKIYKVGSAVIVLAGGYFIFTEILLFLYRWINNTGKRENYSKNRYCGIKDWQMFLFVWVVIATFDLIVLFCAKYPGVLSPDSISQMGQILSKSYSNHHPYYHTQIIHIMVSIGFRLFGNINAAVAVYNVFSVCVMAFCFAYVVYTIFQIRHSLKLAVGIFIWYLIMPFHIMYSFTMWKDVFFGAVVTLYVVSVFRILREVGKHWWVDGIIMLCSAMGMCLLRSNGWFAFVLSTFIFGIILGKKNKKILAIFGGVIVVSFVLKHPVLEVLHVAQPDKIESLSIPTQQIARVIADGKKITSKQKELLSKVVDVNAIPEIYSSHISDPMKGLIRVKGNQEYISQHKGDFIKLYLQIGFAYPQKYVEAWIDQTRGYWNAGYPYWRWSVGVFDNSFGIEGVEKVELAGRILEGYLWLYENVPLLQIFVSIGFHVWLVILSTYIAFCRRDSVVFYISIPHLMVILSLLVATPVFSEFRYAYAIFCSMPFILFVSFSMCLSDKEAELEKA